MKLLLNAEVCVKRVIRSRVKRVLLNSEIKVDNVEGLNDVKWNVCHWTILMVSMLHTYWKHLLERI